MCHISLQLLLQALLITLTIKRLNACVESRIVISSLRHTIDLPKTKMMQMHITMIFS
jgi:hypothetical protein